MPSKRDILNACTRENLLIVAANLDITGLTGMAKDDIIDELARRKSVRMTRHRA